jgi:ABC-2 type transport system permease protein/oleandomycin transport system permease protein
MTTAYPVVELTPRTPPLRRHFWLWRDSWTEALRHLKALPRNPELLVFAALQPIMFVVLFVYVFGGSISVPGYASYEQYVIPGIFAQTVLFGSIYTGLGIAEDLSKGFIDRLRSLPMYSSAMLLGRTMSDVARNALSFAVMLIVAFIVGFRFEGSLWGALGATALLFLFAYAFSWIQAYTGLVAGSAEAVNSIAFLWMFVATFISSAFVAPESMPGWLQPIAEHNPVTIVTDASRALYNGKDPGTDPWLALLWAAGITIVFATLSMRKYRSTTSR